MPAYRTSQKQCATCEYWRGPREFQTDPHVVKCPLSYAAAQGLCQSTNPHANRGKMVHAGSRVASGTCWVCARELKED